MPHRVAPRAVGKTMPKTYNLSPDLREATEYLIRELLASERFLVYQQSQRQIDCDLRAVALLERLAALQAAIRCEQNTGHLVQHDIDELRAVQAQVRTNNTIMTYAQSQQDAADFLREINHEISQILGVDFAVLARQSRC